MMFSSQQEVRGEVIRQLGRPIHPSLWDHLVRQRLVGDVLDCADAEAEERAIADLIEEARKLEALLRDMRENAVVIERAIPPDRRGTAATRILAAIARRQRNVAIFRQDVLAGELLTADQALAWVTDQVEIQGSATTYVRAPLREAGTPSGAPAGRPILLKDWDRISQIPPGYTVREEVDYLGFPKIGQVAVSFDGPLGHLKVVAKDLERWLGWSESTGAWFVLTDETPPHLPVVKSRLEWGLVPAASRIVLEVSPTLKPQQVAKLYSEMRSLYDLPPTRAITEKHAELAVFANEVNDGRSWGNAMGKWNREHSAHQYMQVRLFTRDCRQAYLRVTGMKLSWQGRKRRTARRATKMQLGGE